MDLAMDTKTVAVPLDKELWKRIRRMAVNEETSLALLINEGMAEWLKWICKAEKDEHQEVQRVDANGLEPYQKEMLATQQLIEKYRREKISHKMKMLAKEKSQRDRQAYFRGSYKKKGMVA